jgi:hypothetical protein
MPYAQLAPLAPRPNMPVPGVLSGSFLGTLPKTDLKKFRGPRHTLAMMREHCLGDGGERSMIVRQFVEWVVHDIQAKDYLGEILAIRNVVVQPSPTRPGTPMFKYMNDPRHVEMIKTPERMVREILQHGVTAVDCDEIAAFCGTACLHLGREVELVALGFEPRVLSHVGVRCKEPKTSKWIWLDGVAGPREREAAGRAKEQLVLSLD